MTPRHSPDGAGRDRTDVRRALLDAALDLFRAKGYTATTVDDLCAAAGVTKGAFFHHFLTKEAFGVATMEHWSEVTSELFAAADYHHHPDPLDRVLAYLELRKELLRGSAAEYSCVAGTTVQEIHATRPTIRDAADACIRSGMGHVERYLEELLARRPIPEVTAHGLALHIQAVIQGAIVVAKARDDAGVARESIDHLAEYLRLLFERARPG